ncbi:hypothetical protein ACFRR7_14465 [Streptomyces sp. NPDC056909]|uniref:hypothetical protein n=1 Tax=Streptomyces sp. NPDC056909 TaxID=3345963 RepID=UPI0036B0901F
MTGSPLIHRVPYYSQWESAALVPEFITGTRAAADDPLWPKSGADTREEYAFWAPRMSGVGLTRTMATPVLTPGGFTTGP